jgi:hypothetical protein
MDQSMTLTWFDSWQVQVFLFSSTFSHCLGLLTFCEYLGVKRPEHKIDWSTPSKISINSDALPSVYSVSRLFLLFQHRDKFTQVDSSSSSIVRSGVTHSGEVDR